MPTSTQTYSVPGDANLDHVPSCQIAKSSAPTPSQPHLCPICGRYFERRQERDRHVFSYLPHWIYCPLLDCPWRGNRRYDFKKHWEKFHSDHGEVPEAQKSQIYDADALVKLIVDRHLTINEAAQTIALPEVERRAHELGKKDIWGADRWGRRMRNFE
ncbi:hypothetical protein BJV74DRAFT_846030 [Russula compacta]|nr:hypothetical protein BJV74DRAFT_846030 [Russula compacta]